MKLIDCHTHAFPDFIAEKAISKLSTNCHYEPSVDGTFTETCKIQKEWGCDSFVLLNIATSASSVEKVNDFLIEKNSDKIFSFGSIHPQYGDYKKEIKRLADHGIKGIKFHPDYQCFNIDDKAVYPIYEEIAKHNMVILFHSGFDPAFEGSTRSSVIRGGKMADDFKGAKIIFAHLGNLTGMEETKEHLVGKDVFFDVSMAIRYYDNREIEGFIKSHDINKFLYATDCPWSDGIKTQNMIHALNLTEEDKKKIFYKNAEKLLEVSV